MLSECLSKPVIVTFLNCFKWITISWLKEIPWKAIKNCKGNYQTTCIVKHQGSIDFEPLMFSKTILSTAFFYLNLRNGIIGFPPRQRSSTLNLNVKMEKLFTMIWFYLHDISNICNQDSIIYHLLFSSLLDMYTIYRQLLKSVNFELFTMKL